MQGPGGDADAFSALDTPGALLWQNIVEMTARVLPALPAAEYGGILTLDVAAEYHGLPAGEIPHHEIGPIEAELKRSLPGVLAAATAEPCDVVRRDTPEVGRIAITARVRGDEASTPPKSSIEDPVLLPHTDPEPTRGKGSVSAVGQEGEEATYEEVARRIAERMYDIKRQAAAELAPALNARIQAMPHDTLEQKKELARWVNDQLEPLGLAVRDPKSGLPAKLRGTTGSNQWPDVGRFIIEIYTGGKQKVTSTSYKLPELTLTDATPPPPETKWQQEVGPKETRRGRVRS